MSRIVGGQAKDRFAASTSEMSRFEIKILATGGNLKNLMIYVVSLWIRWLIVFLVRAKVDSYARYITFQLAEVAVPIELFKKD